MSILLCNKAAQEQAVLSSATLESMVENSIVIVPTARQQRMMQRQFIRQSYHKHTKPVPQPLLYTLSTYIQYLASSIEILNKYHVIGDAYRLALFEEVVEQSELLYYRISDEQLSLPVIERLNSIVQGLKKDGITPESLMKDLEALEKSSPLSYKKLSDIITLFAAYEKNLQVSLCDIHSLTRLVVTFLQNHPYAVRERSNNKAALYIVGFTEFSHPEIELLGSLGNQDFPVVLSIEFSQNNGPLFGNVQTTIQHLLYHGFCEITKKESEHYETNDITETNLLSYVRRWLFNTEKPLRNSHFSERVQVYSCQDRIQEVEAIVRLVKYLILEEGIPPGEITIAVRQPDKYASLFRECFKKYAIPLNITDRYSLANAPVVAAIFSVVDVGLRGWRVRDIRRALSSPYLKFFQKSDQFALEQREAAATIDEVAHLLRIADYRRFHQPQQWIDSIDKRINAITALIQRWNDAGLIDESELEQRTKQLQQLEKARHNLSLLFDTVKLPDKTMSAFEFKQLICTHILSRLQVQEAITSLFHHIVSKKQTLSDLEYTVLEEEVEKDARALAEFINVLNEFCYVHQQRFPNKKRSVLHFFNRLKSAVHAAKFQIREKHGYGVTITSPEQTRGIPSQISLLCGFIDGEFPQSYRPEQFLGLELPQSEERHIRSERMQFFEWLANALSPVISKSKLYIFFPLRDGADETIPSPFLDALLRITSIKQDGKFVELLPNSDFLPVWYHAIASRMDYETIIGSVNSLSQRERDTYSHQTEQRLQKRAQSPISVSALEQYGECPFKYEATYILQLQAKRFIRSWFDSPDIGNLFHNIVYRFYSELQKTLPHNLESSLKMSYISLLEEVTLEELERLRFDHPYFPIEVARLLGDDIAKGQLRIWLENEIRKVSAGWDFIPTLFEYSFGQFGKSRSGQQAIKLSDKLTLRGKIDRIEIKEHNDIIEFLVTDYKTGITPTNRDIFQFRSLQLPLYLAAAKHIIEMLYKKAALPMGGIYYLPFAKYENDEKYVKMPLISSHCTQLIEAAGYVKIQTRDHDSLQELADYAVEKGGVYCENIGKGDFPVQPRDNACQKCSYQQVCRISEIGDDIHSYIETIVE